MFRICWAKYIIDKKIDGYYLWERIALFNYRERLSKEIKEEKLKKKREEKRKLRNDFIQQRKEDLESIDIKEWGSISKLAKKWDISHTQVRRWIKKNLPEYIE